MYIYDGTRYHFPKTVWAQGYLFPICIRWEGMKKTNTRAFSLPPPPTSIQHYNNCPIQIFIYGQQGCNIYAIILFNIYFFIYIVLTKYLPTYTFVFTTSTQNMLNLLLYNKIRFCGQTNSFVLVEKIKIKIL